MIFALMILAVRLDRAGILVHFSSGQAPISRAKPLLDCPLTGKANLSQLFELYATVLQLWMGITYHRAASALLYSSDYDLYPFFLLSIISFSDVNLAHQ